MRTALFSLALVLLASPAAAGEWKPAGSVAKRLGVGAFAPSGGRAVVFKGDALTSAYVYSESSNTWTVSPGAYPFSSSNAVALGGDSFLIAAGNVGQVWTDEVWRPSLSTADGTRQGQKLVTLADGRVLATGGRDYLATPELSNAVRIYDPTSKTWADAAPMKERRTGHGVARLGGGKVLVVGGWNGTVYVSSAEVYDPSANTWTTVGSSSSASAVPTVIPLPDGKAAVIGGVGENPVSNVEIFDPVSGSFSLGAALVKPRSEAMAAPLGAKWLIAGGLGPTGNAISDVEIFDPATAKSSAAPSMATARVDGFAVTLSSGSVLVGGGATRIDGAAVVVTTAERYVETIADAGPDATGDGGSDSAVGDAAIDAAAPRPPGDKPALSGNAQRCSIGSDCASGFCVEGVCCNERCDRKCFSCALPSSPGVCTAEPAGIDLKAECGVAKACVSTCSGTGECIGAGPGSMCARNRCDGPARGFGAAYCSAAGVACNEGSGASFDCTPFACEPAFGACVSQCSKSADCAPGYLCDAPSRLCVAPPPTDSDSGCAVSTVGEQSAPSLLILLATVGLLGKRLRRPQNKSR